MKIAPLLDSFSENEQTRLQALKLYKEGRSQKEIAATIGVSQTTIAKWYKKYVNGGYEGIKYKRKISLSKTNLSAVA
jgi:transposase